MRTILKLSLLTFLMMFSFSAVGAQNIGIAGRVLWSDGTAAVGMRLTAIVTTTEGLPATYVVGTKAAATALTDNTGRYRIANLPAGRYHVVTGPVSFPRTFSDVAASNSPHLATVTPGKTVDDMNFTIVKDYHGGPFDSKMVLTVTGKIVRGIYNGSDATHVVVTNSDGSTTRWQMRASDSPATRPWWPGYDNGIGGEIDKMSRAGETVTISGNDTGYGSRADFHILYVHEVTRGGLPQ